MLMRLEWGPFFLEIVIHSFVMDSPALRNLHINYKKVLAVVFAAKCWCHQWNNKHVIIQTDSTTAVNITIKGTAKNPIPF